MEDDDDAQSYRRSSPSSASPDGQDARSASWPPPPVSPEEATLPAAAAALIKAAALSSGGGGGGGSGGGRDDCWSEGATAVLIEAWGERFMELSRGNLRQHHWQEVADIVSARDDYTKPPKSDVQCKNRVDTLKKKYKLEKSRAGAAPASKWAFFRRLDQLLGSKPPSPTSSSLAAPPAKAKRPNHVRPAPRLPATIPVGPRSFHHFQKKKALLPSRRSAPIAVAAAAAAAAAAEAAPSPESWEGPPAKVAAARKRAKGEEEGREGLRDLTKAILKFGEVYERVESSKLKQVVEMEKQRMGFTKELELQRMQFFMKTQLELTQLKRDGGGAALAHAAATSNTDNSD